jgi:hypothetical protein
MISRCGVLVLALAVGFGNPSLAYAGLSIRLPKGVLVPPKVKPDGFQQTLLERTEQTIKVVESIIASAEKLGIEESIIEPYRTELKKLKSTRETLLKQPREVPPKRP